MQGIGYCQAVCQFLEILFPVAWISGFGLGTLRLWLDTIDGKSATLPPDETWPLMGDWIAGAAFILWGCAGPKRARVDSTNLYVSNYLREILVPLGMIADITENV
jgi:hypothetical protein